RVRAARGALARDAARGYPAALARGRAGDRGEEPMTLGDVAKSPSPAPSIITLRDVSKTYARAAQQVRVLDGIDFDVAAGAYVALMGPSGSGKTTLLNLIAGLDRPS